MAVTHSTAFRNTVADAHTTALGATPQLKFRLAGTVAAPGAIVANLVFSATPFGAAAAGVATANAITSDINATGNASAVATATLQTSGGTVISHCAVAAAASDINMTGGLIVGAGDTVSCSSLTYTAMP
jgi:hypothetical protein